MPNSQRSDIDFLSERILEVWKDRWPITWDHQGCYLHLEVSEFIESLRGKGHDSKEKEAADILFVLLGCLLINKISISKVLTELENIIRNFEEK